MADLNRRAVVGWASSTAALGFSGHSSAGTIVDQAIDNKAVLQRFIEQVWRKGRIDELPTFWAADCVNHADPATDNHGLAALRRYHEGFASAFADFQDMSIEIQQQVSEGDRVVTQMLTRAIHRPSKRPVKLATIRIDRIADGKIAEHWSVADMAGLMQQLG